MLSVVFEGQNTQTRSSQGYVNVAAQQYEQNNITNNTPTPRVFLVEWRSRGTGQGMKSLCTNKEQHPPPITLPLVGGRLDCTKPSCACFKGYNYPSKGNKFNSSVVPSLSS